MIAEHRTPPNAEQPVTPNPSDPEYHLQHLLTEQTSEPWYKSLYNNLKDAINPPKLPPLELTSQPIPVKSIWSKEEGRAFSGFASILVHAGVIGLLIFLGTNKKVQEVAKQTVTLIAPNLEPYKPKLPVKKQTAGGGGGGGDRSPTPPAKGQLPKISPKQFTPPQQVIENKNPKLPMEPTIDIQPDIKIANNNMNQWGNPMDKMGLPSNGPGAGGGIGSGKGGGIGSGDGRGLGPGSGGGTGGGAYRIGGGVSQPQLVYKTDPEYSEEARKAKFQGVVVLSIVVEPDGHVSNVKVVRALGLGLDEKAIEAVMKWRFKPGLKDGRAVPVMANVEVNFRLL